MNQTLLNNRYQILQILGRGGFGETFLAIDTHMPSARKCVIKQLKPSIQAPEIPEWLQERFKREAAVLEELGENHPQIPRLYAYFCEGGKFYLVQEWIEGPTLSQKHQQQGNFSVQAVRTILLYLLPVLDFVHSRRIIHRDIKPDNIILRDSDGKPVLIDFGVMKEAVATVVNLDGTTTYSVILGTPGYMSSEQAAGRPVYASDLYSLGLTAIFLLTGKTPQYLATDANTGELLWRQDLLDGDSHLATVIDRAIHFHPRDRFASAKEMLAALQNKSATSTAATIAVTSQAKLGKINARSTIERSGITPSAPTESENVWMQWFLGLLLFAGITAGAFAIGYYAFSLRSPSSDSPYDSTPQTFPPISPDTPTPTYTPEPEATTSPTPETTPTIEPEATTSPTPETTPTIEPEATTSPTPETTPTIEPEATVSPTPEETLNIPTPDLNPSPEASPSPTEESEEGTEPSPPSDETTPEPTVSPEPEPTQESKNSPPPEIPVLIPNP
jgi:serine/threonine-protein kinase